MKPVDQDRFGSPDGNCFAACVASIFEMPLADVPHFMHLGDAEWFPAFRAWAIETLECDALEVLFDADNWWLKACPAPLIVSGPAERGLDHCTIWLNGAMVHDPHPSRAGLIKVAAAMLFVPLRPERLRGKP